MDYTYDALGQLKTARGKETGGATNRLHEQFSYLYDAAGNLAWRTNNANVQQFKTDNLNRLTNVTRTAGSTLTVAGATSTPATNVTVNSLTAARYADLSFAKDGFTITNGWNSFTAIAWNDFGQSDTNTISAYLPSSFNPQYDLNGNLTNDGRRVFFYDDENQLTTVLVSNAWKSEFVYDGKMRRRVRKEYGWQSGAWTLTNEVRYVYDGNLVIQERSSANAPLVSYTRGLDASGTREGSGGIWGLLARTDDTTQASAYYHADGVGNTTCLIDTNTVVVARYQYDPFGNLVYISGSLAEPNTYRFSSKEYHPNSGLICYLRRYYEPNFQRWINADPVEEKGGINLYRFASNVPTRKVDPTGLTPLYALPKDTRPGMWEWSCYGNCGLGYWNDGMSGRLFAASRESNGSGGGSAEPGSDPGDSDPDGTLLDSNRSRMQSWFGRLLGHIPLIGGLLGAAGDLFSGALKTSVGLITFGQSGTLGRGLGEIGLGVHYGLIESFSLAGKAWSSPNTAIGLIIGSAGLLFGAHIDFKNNAIQFLNFPWGSSGALTLGNVQLYRGSIPTEKIPRYDGLPGFVPLGLHEQVHTYQYELLGPFFLPLYFIQGGIPRLGDKWINPLEKIADDLAQNGRAR